MQILKTRLSNGSPFPVLIRKEPYQPILVPFIYNVIHLKGKAENTKRNILTSIKYFYSFFESEYCQDVDELLITAKFNALIERTDEFVYWISLQAGKRQNPYRNSNRFRNWLIIQMFIKLGLRMGDSDGEYGADVWVRDLETKIANMKKALDIKPVELPVKVFPEGKQFTIAFEERKGSSV